MSKEYSDMSVYMGEKDKVITYNICKFWEILCYVTQNNYIWKDALDFEPLKPAMLPWFSGRGYSYMVQVVPNRVSY